MGLRQFTPSGYRPGRTNPLLVHQSRRRLGNRCGNSKQAGGPLGAAEADAAAIVTLEIETTHITPADLGRALGGFDHVGRRRGADPRVSNEGLNVADYFSYATARRQRLPIFYLDAEFLATDLKVVAVA